MKRKKLNKMWFKMNADNLFKYGFVIFFIGLIFGFTFLGIILYDSLYYLPVADDNANKNCKSNGFDQFKSYSRIGLLSTNPIGIKCEFAEKYTDLGIRK